MNSRAVLVGSLRPELGVSGDHDGLLVADIRHPDAVESLLATDAGLEDDQKYTETTVEVPLSGDARQDAPLYAALSGNPVALAS